MRTPRPRAGAAFTLSKRRALEDEVCTILLEAEHLEAAAPRILRAVGTVLACQFAICWLDDPGSGEARRLATWDCGTEGACSPAMARAQPVALREEAAALSPSCGACGDAEYAIPFGHAADGTPRCRGVIRFFGAVPQRPARAWADCAERLAAHIGRFLVRSEAARALADRERTWRDTIELAPAGMNHVDLNGRFMFVNRGFCEMTGYSREELTGMTTRQISHPDDRDATADLRPQLRAGLIDSIKLEKRYLRKDGSFFWARIRIALKRSPTGVPLHDISIIEDVTDRVRAEQELRASETRFRSLTALSSDWYWEQDAVGQFTRVEGNGRMQELLGFSAETAGMVPEAGWEWHKQVVGSRQAYRDWIVSRGIDDHEQFLSLSGEPVFDHGGAFAGYRGVARDVTERKRSEARIQYLATHDSLTGLPNRAMFAQLLNLAVENARRYGHGFVVGFIDLDGFKRINDSLGHEAGDQLLRETAARLKAAVRASDVVARLGGDEFVVLIDRCQSRENAVAVANHLLAAANLPMALAGDTCRVGASIGIAQYPTDAEDGAALMKDADVAMYVAKREGKNTYRFYADAVAAHTRS